MSPRACMSGTVRLGRSPTMGHFTSQYMQVVNAYRSLVYPVSLACAAAPDKAVSDTLHTWDPMWRGLQWMKWGWAVPSPSGGADGLMG